MVIAVRLLVMVWASPYTLTGILIGTIGLCTGGRARRVGRTLEFWGGAVSWMIGRLPIGQVMALTLGHTILGHSDAALDLARDHELVHVRQFERWGVLMGPAYGISSLMAWSQGRRPYRDNWFERQAYGDF